MRGYFQNIAVRVANQTYKPISQADLKLVIHPTSVLSNICPLYVLYHEVV
jgi:hypothetical protein